MLLFLQSILLGLSAGIFYDLLRPFRRRLKRLTAALDFFYAAALAITSFFFLLRPAEGELRGYLVTGVLGGAVYYLVSRFVIDQNP